MKVVDIEVVMRMARAVHRGELSADEAERALDVVAEQVPGRELTDAELAAKMAGVRRRMGWRA